MFIFEAKPSFMKVFYSRLHSLCLLLLLLFAVRQEGLAQCVLQGTTIADPACGGSPTTVNNAGGGQQYNANSTIGADYTVAISSGSGAGCGSYSVTPASFTANASTTTVTVQAGGACCWASGNTSAILTYTRVAYTNTTSNSNICVGGQRGLTVSPVPANAGTWSVAGGTGTGTISGTTFTAQTAGTVTIRYTKGGCSSDVSFTIVGQPTATQGSTNTASICATSNTYTIPAGYGSSNGTISWAASSTSGTNGTIANGTTLTPTYTFSAADKSNGATVTLTMTVSNGTCIAATTTFTLTIAASPTATQGVSHTASVCANTSTYTVPAGYASSHGTILWTASSTSGTTGAVTNATTLTPTYTFSAADISSGATVILTMTVSNSPCTAATTTFALTIAAVPSATQGTTHTATVCATTSSYTVPVGYASSNGTISWAASSTSGTNGTVTNGTTLTPTYTFSAADIASGASVTLTMSVSNGICATASTTFTLTIVAAPTATQGITHTASVCASSNFYTLTAGYGASNGTIAWTASSTSGTNGSVTNATTLTPTYNFSAADISSGATVTLTMTVSNATCASASTTFTLTVVPAPTATQGTTHTATVCATTSSYTVPAGYASSNGTISWAASSTSGTNGTVTNGTTLTPTYTFSPADIAAGATVTLTMTVSNSPCAAATTTFALTVVAAPTATQGTTHTASACASSNFYTIPAGYASGNGTIAWTASSTSGSNGIVSNATTLTPSYTFSAADISSGATVTLTMTVSNGTCSSASTTFTLTVLQIPTATQGSTHTATVCATSNSYAVPAGYSSTNGTISWSASSTSGTNGTITNGSTLTPTYNFSAADILSGATVTLTMTVSNAPCTSATTTFTLTINPAPSATQGITHTATTCATANTYTIPAGYASSNGTIAWTASSSSGTNGAITNGTTLTPTYNFSAADISSGATVTLTMTVSNSPCAAATTTFVLTVVAAPTATQGSTHIATVCASTNSYTVPSGYASSNGTIAWTASSTSGTNGTVSNGTTLTPTYNFSPADISSGATVTLTMTVSNATCASASTTFTLGIDRVPTVATASGTLNVCGSLTSLSLGGNIPTVGAGTWTLTSGPGIASFSNLHSSSSTASVSVVGTYIFTWTIANGTCPSTSANDTVNYYATPTAATVGATQNICGSLTTAPLGGNTPSVGTGTWTQTSGPGTTIFSNVNSGSSTATASPAGTYVYTWTISNGTCTPSAASVTVHYILTPNGGSVPDVSFCSSAATSTVSAVGVSNANQYTWALPAGLSGSSTASTITVGGTVPGTYTVTVTPLDVAFGVTCSGTPMTGIVKILSMPVIDSVNAGTLSCFGGSNDTVRVYGRTNNGTLFYSINGGTTYPNSTGIFSNLPAGSYNVSVRDDSSCATIYGSNPVKVIPPPDILVSIASFENILCNSDSTGRVNVAASGGTGVLTFLWNNGSTAQNISHLAAGTYTVTVKDANGCTKTISQTLTEPSHLTDSIAATNISCYGANDAKATYLVSGGTPPYKIQWSTGDTTATITNLNAAIYSVTATDNNGCRIVNSVNIINPLPLAISVSVTNVSCYGAGNGEIDVIAQGGTGAFSYTWSPSVSTSSTVTNAAPGTYTVTVSDVNNCSAVDSGTVTQPLSGMSLSSIVTPLKCSGDNNGSIQLLPSGGVGGYIYKWSNGDSLQIISGLGAGIYNATVTDGNGCQATIADTLDNHTPITSSIFGSSPLCAGSNNGSATLSISGGTQPYTYLWSNFASAQNLTNISGGFYTVVVTDANGCEHRDTVTITEPLPVTISLSTSNIDCNGANNGSIIAHAAGGVGGYGYSWNPNVSVDSSVTNAGPGTYIVNVYDDNGCPAVDSFTITQPTALLLQGTVNNVNCSGGNTGSVYLTVSGGTPSYTYGWSNNTTGQNLLNAGAGQYFVTVTDSKGCSQVDSFTVTSAPSTLAVTDSIHNVDCNGNSNGSVTTAVTGGIGSYTYIWSNGASTPNLINIPAGLYTLTVSDSLGCTTSLIASVTEPAPLLGAPYGQQNNACYGDSSAIGEINVTGGTQPYTYQWYSVGQQSFTPLANSNTDLIFGLAAGSYIISVTDANGCNVDVGLNITQPNPILVSGIVSGTNCNGDSSGTVTLTVSGGTGGYGYTWSDGSTASTLSGKPIGTYYVSVTDANGCLVIDSFTITQPTALTVQGTVNNVSCGGGNTGSVYLTVNGGTPSYSYNWSNSTSSQNLLNAGSGQYFVTVTDSKGCSQTDSFTITSAPSTLAVTDSIKNVDCNGNSTGAIKAIVTGGTGSYTYSWSNGATTANLIKLPAGVYTLTVTDSLGCSVVLVANVTQPSPLVASVFGQQNNACFGDSSGIAEVSVTGGTQPYNYQWINQTVNGSIPLANSNSDLLFGLPAGSYIIFVADSNGCSSTTGLNITQPNPILVSASVTNTNCNGDSTGSVSLTVSGGTGSYSYAWSDGSAGSTLSGKSIGIYYVTVTDANGCSVVDSFAIAQPTALTLQGAVNNVNCSGGNTGSVYLTVSGGTPSYTYNWSNGASSQNLLNVGAGLYYVAVTDSKGCSQKDSFTVTSAPSTLAVTDSVHNVDCNGNSTGSITTTVTGGTGSYTYNWSNGASTASLSNLPAGVYTLTVSDSLGCSVVLVAEVKQPSTLTAAIYGQLNNQCYGDSSAVTAVNIYGGTQPYQIQWSQLVPPGFFVNVPNGAGNFVGNLKAGVYIVNITDSNGCQAQATANITQPSPVLVGVSVSNVRCYGDSNGSVSLNVSGGTGAYNYTWSDGSTGSTLSGKNVGTYFVTVTDANGCSVVDSATITQPASAIIVTTVVSNLTCNGSSDGSILVLASGGTGSYTYQWSNGQTTQLITSLSMATPTSSSTLFTVTITDANGCIVVSNDTLRSPSPISSSIVGTDVTCAGYSNGSATLTVSGGATPYNFLWSNFAATQNLTNVPGGFYTVIITDSSGCQHRDTVTIHEPLPLVISASVTNVNCNGDSSGSISLTVNGGTGSYTFVWSDGSSASSLTGKGIGTYFVTVSDANNCSLIDSFTITQPTTLTLQGTVNNVNCGGGNTGSVYLTVSGGTPSYSYSWSNNTSSQNLLNAGSGQYFVTVTDSKGCSQTDSFTITSAASTLAVTASVVNIDCNGNNNGSITTTVTGGTGSYTYSWSNGAATPNLSGLNAGVYTLTVADSLGCSVLLVAEVKQPAPLTAAIYGQLNNQCFGDSSAITAVNIYGGTLPYHIQWEQLVPPGFIVNVAGDTDVFAYNLKAGVYIANVIDSNGCQAVATANITQPSQVVVIGTVANVSCAGGGNGAVTLNVSGGTGSYTYTWSDGSHGSSLIGKTPGTYYVSVTDANGCLVVDSFTITQPTALTLQGTVNNGNCGGGNNGSVYLTVNGGTPSYSYNWSNNTSSQNLLNVGAGQYFVTVTDSKGCSQTDSFTVTSAASTLAVTDVIVNIDCNGNNNGSITTTVTGGIGSYTYSWSNGATTPNLSGLNAGVYTLTVADSLGCSVLLVAEVKQPAPLTAAIYGQLNNQCFGDSSAITAVNIYGGTLPYHIQWEQLVPPGFIVNVAGDTDVFAYNLKAGVYIANVIDSNGCQAVATANITQPSQVLVLGTVTNVACNGGSNGSVTLNVSGGTGSYTYTWSDGSHGSSLTGQNPGTYYVSVTDANGCLVADSFTITQPPVLNVQSTVSNISCSGSADGSISLSVSGGTPAYTFNWNSGQHTPVITNLVAGIYIVTVADANGCSMVISDTVRRATPIISATSGTNVTCAGSANGTASVSSVSGGVAPYHYLWSNFAATQSISGLSGGLYYVIITDAGGCEHRDSVLITEPQALVASISSTNVSCFGAGNGTVTVSVTGGIGTYTYSWTPNVSNGPTVTNATPGTYVVTVKDSNNCTVTDSAKITQPASGLLVQSTVASISCSGSTNGSISLSVSGGTPSYTFNWSSGQHTQVITNLPAGTYVVTVTDANGCNLVINDTVKVPTPITSSVLGANMTCAGAHNGSAQLTVNGGQTPYSFLWSNFAGTQNIDSLSGGLYHVVITDANGCQHRDSVFISEPLPLSIALNVTPISCNNTNDGSIAAVVTGGTGASSFLWSPGGQITPTISNLSANTYTVTVKDVNNCTASSSTTLVNPSTLSVASVVINPKCNGANNGIITLVVNGGTPQYAYNWSGGLSGGQSVINVAPGNYFVTVTDSHGCTATDSANVVAPSPIYVSGIITNVRCAGNHDGSAIVTVYGGSTPYSYQWYADSLNGTPGPITKDWTQLAGGDYYLSITDDNNCAASYHAVIKEADSLKIAVSKTDLTCFGANNGAVAVTVTGGVTPYHYLWNNFVTDSSQTAVAAGNYGVIVTDSNGCQQTKTINVNQPLPISVSVATVNPSCLGSATGSISLNVSGGTGAYSYSWSTTPVQSTSTASNLAIGTYYATITDGNSCSVIDSATLTSPQALVVNTAISNPTCSDGDNGFVSLDVHGGSAPYAYNWSTIPVQTGNVASSLAAGTYIATITDNKGCQLLDTAIVSAPQPIVISVASGNSTCINSADGNAVVNVTGGLAPYTYQLGALAQNSDTFSNLLPGTYALTVKDANGCQAVSNWTIVPSSSFSVSLSATPDVVLSGETVQLTAIATSDTTVTGYVWNTLDSLNFSGCPDPNNCPTPTATPSVSHTYVVEAVNARGCIAIDTVHVTVRNQPSAFIPSGFTPNGDHLNDRFEFDILGAKTIDVQVWNRWGEKVYSDPAQTNGITGTHGWDGTFRGQLAEYDTYTYQFTVTYYNGHQETMAGTVTLMR